MPRFTARARATKKTYADFYAEGPAALLATGDQAAHKAVYRAAFGAAWQPDAPWEVRNEDELTALARQLLAHIEALRLRQQQEEAKKNKKKNTVAGSLEQLLEGLVGVIAEGAHTHSSRYVHASATAHALHLPAPGADPAYLSSATAGNQRHLAASLSNLAYVRTARLLLANFTYQGRHCSFATLLLEGDPAACAALRAVGVPAETVERAVAQLRAQADAALNRAEPLLPQLLWPVNGGYVALQAMPSIAVFNALAAQGRRQRADAYLPRTQATVGAGNAINVSTYAVETNGRLPALRCEPPRITRTRIDRLLGLAFAKRLVRRPRIAHDPAFDVNIWPRTNADRAAFLRRAARRHAATALARVLQLGEAFDPDNARHRDAAAALSPAQQKLVRQQRLSAAHIAALTDDVVAATCKETLKKHAPSDVTAYLSYLAEAITEL